MDYACSLENYRTLIAFREFESHTLRQVKGSVQQTKTLVLCKVLADKNDPVKIGELAHLGEQLLCKQ